MVQASFFRYTLSRGVLIFWTLGLTLGCQSAKPSAVSPRPEPPTVLPALAGTSWIVEEIDARGVLEHVQSTVTFETAERLAGSTGCNRISGPVRLSGTTVRLGPLVSTRAACSPPVMDQERRFLAGLDAARTYQLDGGRLWLLNEGGQRRMRLARLEATIGRRHVFACRDGPRFTLTVVAADAVSVALPGGQVQRLTRDRTASGTRYTDGRVTVWTKGREASLELDGRRHECAEVPA